MKHKRPFKQKSECAAAVDEGRPFCSLPSNGVGIRQGRNEEGAPKASLAGHILRPPPTPPRGPTEALILK